MTTKRFITASSGPDYHCELLRRLKETFPQLSEGSVAVRAVGAPKRFTHSTVETLDILHNHRLWRRVVVKRPHGERGADPAEELRALQTLEAHFSGRRRLHVPRALCTLNEPPALVMEMVEGVRLHQAFRAFRRAHIGAKSGRVRAMRCAGEAGRWLAHLHGLPVMARVRLVEDLEARLEWALGVFSGLGGLGVDRQMTIRNAFALTPSPNTISPHPHQPPPGQSTRNPFAKQVMTTRNELSAPHPTPTVSLHGDYTLRNIICHAGQGVTVFDTELALIGPPAYDIGHFLAALRFIDRGQPLTRGRLYADAALNDLKRAFLTGYASERALPSRGEINQYAAIRLLERWAELSLHLISTRPRIARGLLHLFVHPYFYTTVQRMLSHESI
ncbi:MAG: aminoglycoside phosphotransferase family protein [Chloroflexi bacterium]|nr:aminoglycoside phosphotransferase family protein [Chloroflexota bacterium]